MPHSVVGTHRRAHLSSLAMLDQILSSLARQVIRLGQLRMATHRVDDYVLIHGTRLCCCRSHVNLHVCPYFECLNPVQQGDEAAQAVH